MIWNKMQGQTAYEWSRTRAPWNAQSARKRTSIDTNETEESERSQSRGRTQDTNDETEPPNFSPPTGPHPKALATRKVVPRVRIERKPAIENAIKSRRKLLLDNLPTQKEAYEMDESEINAPLSKISMMNDEIWHAPKSEKIAILIKS